MVHVQSKTATHAPAIHAITFDVEEWFHAHNLRIPRGEWSTLPSRVERCVDLLLDQLASHGSTATFFVLGWVARRNPDLIRRLRDAGHEIASHGDNHQSLLEMTRPAFRQDVVHSKRILEDITGEAVLGYRAPRYSITKETIWALDILQELGFRYDSSIYPVRAPHRKYGIANTPLHPHRVSSGFWEFPLATLKVLGKRLPAATGAYLRLLPRCATRACLAQYENMNAPAVVNIHPWELDPGQPRRRVPIACRWIHYTNLGTTSGKLDWLLSTYRFAPLRALLADLMHKSVSMPKSSVLPSRSTSSRDHAPGTHRHPSNEQIHQAANASTK